MPLSEGKYYSIEDIYALPEGKRAELIDGRMYMMASPTTRHQRLQMRISSAIYNYIQAEGGDCEVFSSSFAVFLNDDHDYVEPDITVVCDPSRIDDKGCHGAPDWVIEIVSPASRSMDYMLKLFKYRSEGVREYWIVDPDRNMVSVYSFEKDEMKDYSLQEPVPAGIYGGQLTIRPEEP